MADVESKSASQCNLSKSAGVDLDHKAVDYLLKNLQSQNAHERQEACHDLAKQGCRGASDRIVESLIARLQYDKDAYVRQAAACALGQSSAKGNREVLAALGQHCSMDADSTVRRVATTSLGQVASRGCPSTVSVLLPRLEDKDGGVRRSALKALERVVDFGNVHALRAIWACAKDHETHVRQTSVEVLSKISKYGDRTTLKWLLEVLRYERESRVRCVAVQGLGRLAPRGDDLVLQALHMSLDDPDDDVRRAAAHAIGQVTFAPFEELEVQEGQISKLKSYADGEIKVLLSTIKELRENYFYEIERLNEQMKTQQSLYERQINERDLRLKRCQEQIQKHSCLDRVTDFLPHADQVTHFLETLPTLSNANYAGSIIVAPVWALRSIRNALPSTVEDQQSAITAGCPLDDKRDMLEIFDLFQELSTGRKTTMKITDSQPLDVYVHKSFTDSSWGLYCCNHQRLCALLMRQACARDQHLTVRCVIRSKDDGGYWSWYWRNFHDNSNGLSTSPIYKPTTKHCGVDGSLSPKGRRQIDFINSRESSPSAPHFRPSCSSSTTDTTPVRRRVRPESAGSAAFREALGRSA